jgi:hypothetical protein
MAKINLAKLASGNRHTVNVTLHFEDHNGGGKTTEQMRVVYRGTSLREGRELQEKLKTIPDERDQLIEALTRTVLELPDLEDQGQPVPVTPEFFNTLDTYYLNRINQAIQDDRSGND